MKVLIPLDGSTLADAVVGHLVDLVQRDRAACEVHLLRAVDPDAGSAAEAREHLGGVEARLAGLGFRTRTAVVALPPVQAILERVVGERVDLVAMSTHGRSGLGRLLRGSVAEGVLRGCTASLLLVNPRALEAEHRYRRVLLPIDAATVVEDALPLVRALAKASGATVVLLALGDPARPLLEQARTALEQDGAPTSTSEALGAPADPAGRILAACQGRAVDLVVLCTGPRAWRSRWPIAQAEDDVLRQAPCPVLLLRAPVSLDPRA